ncbi:DUF4388 domain-containing protein, partial [Thermodesulfobacteriota bacterium]
LIMATREISAKTVVADLRGGMDNGTLMAKYRLSPLGLNSLFRKLLFRGLITRYELLARTDKTEEVIDLSGLDPEATLQVGEGRPDDATPQHWFSGRVDRIDILDYIQCMLMTGRRTVLEIRAAGGAMCKLYLDKGQIVHAATNEIRGPEALYQCALFSGGEFFHLPWTEPEKRTINNAGSLLLLEAARRRDEEADPFFE